MDAQRQRRRGVERRVEEDLKNPPVDGPDGPELLRLAVDDHRRNGPLAAGRQPTRQAVSAGPAVTMAA